MKNKIYMFWGEKAYEEMENTILFANTIGITADRMDTDDDYNGIDDPCLYLAIYASTVEHLKIQKFINMIGNMN